MVMMFEFTYNSLKIGSLLALSYFYFSSPSLTQQKQQIDSTSDENNRF